MRKISDMAFYTFRSESQLASNVRQLT